MASIGIAFYAELNGIFCESEILGSSITINRSGLRCRIDIPDSPDCFEFVYVSAVVGEPSARDPRTYKPTTALIEHDAARSLIELRLIRVVLNTENPMLSVASFDARDPDDRAIHDSVFNQLRKNAIQLARDFSEWVSIELRQPWIEPSGEYPRIVNSACLVDLDAQQEFGILVGAYGLLRVIGSKTTLSSESLERVRELMESRGSPQSDELLLSEAKFILGGESVAGPQRATLLAAISLELCLKRTLRSLTYPQNSSRRNHSPHRLFRNVLPTILECPLGSDHRRISKAVQQLFEARNAIVHDGAEIEKVDAERYVATAEEASDFLRLLEGEEPQ